jgi:hypothetical protein
MRSPRKILTLLMSIHLLVLTMFAYTPSYAAISLSNIGYPTAGYMFIGDIGGGIRQFGYVYFSVPATNNYRLNDMTFYMGCIPNCTDTLHIELDDWNTTQMLGEADVQVSATADYTITFPGSVQLLAGHYYYFIVSNEITDATIWMTSLTPPAGEFIYEKSTSCHVGGGTSCGNLAGGQHFVISINASVIPAKPTLSAPANKTHTLDTTPTFTWNVASGASDYRIMVYTEDKSFIFKKVVTGTGYTVTTPLVPGVKYLWRVRGKSAENVWGAFSPRNILFVD